VGGMLREVGGKGKRVLEVRREEGLKGREEELL